MIFTFMELLIYKIRSKTVTVILTYLDWSIPEK